MENSKWTILGQPQGNPQVILKVAMISLVLFLIISWFSMLGAVVGVFFALVGAINSWMAMKQRGYLAISQSGVEYRNDYLPSLNTFYPFEQIGLISFWRKQVKSGVLLKADLLMKDGKKIKWEFEEGFQAYLVQFQQLMIARGTGVQGEIPEKKTASFSPWHGGNTVIYMPVWMLAQLVFVSCVYGFFYYQEEQSKKAILANTGYTIATTTGLGSNNHGTCGVTYTYQVNGNRYNGESPAFIESTPNQNGLHKMRDTALVISPTGERFLIAYDQNNPATHRILLQRYIVTQEDSTYYFNEPITMEDLE